MQRIVWDIKAKKINWSLLKFKVSAFQDFIMKTKKKITHWEKMSLIDMSVKGLASTICKECS